MYNSEPRSRYFFLFHCNVIIPPPPPSPALYGAHTQCYIMHTKLTLEYAKFLQSENDMLINLLDAFYIKNVSVK